MLLLQYAIPDRVILISLERPFLPTTGAAAMSPCWLLVVPSSQALVGSKMVAPYAMKAYEMISTPVKRTYE